SVPGQPVPTRSLRLPFAVKPGRVRVDLLPFETVTAAPGAYSELRASPQSVLRLASGRYDLERLAIARGARLVFDTSSGPVLLYVRDALDFSGVIEETGGSGRLLVHAAED